jgi:hypothetical protein
MIIAPREQIAISTQFYSGISVLKTGEIYSKSLEPLPRKIFFDSAPTRGPLFECHYVEDVLAYKILFGFIFCIDH